MRTHSRKSHRAARGQSLVELAISLTVIILLLAGAVTFGMAFFSYVAIRDAAQEGALFGSFNPYEDVNGDGAYNDSPTPEPVNAAAIRERVRASSTSPIDFSNTTLIPDSYITVEAVTGMACEGLTGTAPNAVPNAVRVTVEYDYPVFMPFVGAIIGGQTIHLTATVTDTILEPRCPA